MTRFFGEAAEAQLRVQAKQALRRKLIAVRRKLPEERIQQRSASIAAQLQQHPALTDAKVVAGYCPVGGEVDPQPILDALRSRGCRIVLPRQSPQYEDATMSFAEATKPLVQSPLGYWMPDPAECDVPLSALDALLIPAVAADPQGNRLGRGGGHYDRVLSEAQHATTVALIYDFQLLLDLPVEAHDVAVDWVATETDLYAHAAADASNA